MPSDGKYGANRPPIAPLEPVYSNFRTQIVNDDGIEQTDGYTCGPESNKLILKFERIEKN